MTANQTYIPRLRFSEFETPWKTAVLGDIATFSKGKGISKSDIDPDGQTYCVRYGELYTSYDTIIDRPLSKTSVASEALVLSEGGEVIVPASGETAEDIATAAVVVRPGVALGGDLNIVRSPLDGGFLAFYLSGKKRMTLASMAQGNSVVHLYPAQLSTLHLGAPTLPEQQKIVGFLGVVDAKIAQLAKKKRLLEDYKKGCMQKLFSQQIRFKDDNGNDFPAWEEKRLGELFERVRQKNDIGNKNVLTISAQAGLVNQMDYFNHSVAAKDTSGYYLLEKGDFAYNKSYSKGYPMGAIKRLNYYDHGIVSTLYICFRAKNSEFEAFYECYFDSGLQNRWLAKITQEGARNHGLLNMAIEDFFDMPLPYPHPDEQLKIADFLSSLDRKIDLVCQEYSHAQVFKKGLLQQMFV